MVRASVRPDNIPSRRLPDQYGFQEAGEQWDEVDGLETILEVPCQPWALSAARVKNLPQLLETVRPAVPVQDEPLLRREPAL